MDRFIDPYAFNDKVYNKPLKSNMDRFIECFEYFSVPY